MRTRRHDQEPPHDDRQQEVAVLPAAVWSRGERPLQLPTFRSTGQQHQPVRKRGLLKCTTSLRLGRNVACLSGKIRRTPRFDFASERHTCPRRKHEDTTRRTSQRHMNQGSCRVHDKLAGCSSGRSAAVMSAAATNLQRQENNLLTASVGDFLAMSGSVGSRPYGSFKETHDSASNSKQSGQTMASLASQARGLEH